MAQLLRYVRPQMITAQRWYTTPAPKNVLEGIKASTLEQKNGGINYKKPIKVQLEEGKKYKWCLCGRSKSQPFCDGRHNNIFLNIYYKVSYSPIPFKVAKTGDYWLCTCKQTKNRPFCDGTHKLPEIQAAVK